MRTHGENPGEIASILIGSSAATRELRDEVEFASRLVAGVMIAGESGVGKKRLAELIHRQSVRGRAQFVPVKCADPDDAQLEARLFGDVRRVSRTGALERAEGGTIFLEDVDALSATLQSRLMHFLVTGHVLPVGRSALRPRVNVRIICSTTIPLIESLTRGSFRADLYYLLNTVYLPIPPLRDRPEDVQPLLEYFTAYYARRNGVVPPQLTLECLASCLKYEWPGNVRQLQATAALLSHPSAQALDVRSSNRPRGVFPALRATSRHAGLH
jgi:DNA-binding NtrC family response regulator